MNSNSALVKRSVAWARRVRYAYELAAPRRYLFVMSHMRSYSTLLCHILNSNPAIDGYVEMHKAYTRQLELLELTLRVRHTTGTRLRGRYVVDKVLHNYAMHADVLGRNDVYAIYSVRAPEQSIRSIIAMGLRRKKPDWKSDHGKVVNHYIRRMRRLEELSALTTQRSAYVEAELIVDDTQRVLNTLTSFLELKTPLTPQYQTSEHTGRPGMGDASPFIATGKIVATRDDYSNLEIDPALMDQAREAYEQCRVTLARNCTVAVDTATTSGQATTPE